MWQIKSVRPDEPRPLDSRGRLSPHEPLRVRGDFVVT